MKAKNINGTADFSCPCGSWLKHWENLHGSEAVYCSAFGCSKPAEVGAHVRKDDKKDQKWYIIPLCKKHNNQTEELEVSASTDFVPAIVSSLCGP
jgi:hypothetical protein